ncbi:hypothetical protein F2P81_010241 [Scophthalmus maximus]|uniref:Uncharacterized protein n=1 Tax=Scophthalmus maximus TaxID=52904 RepID=A0A6A4SV68_SCOMX|nr:hypothetical protein F2P81_010241 [Scophthalmus maximus]
MRRRMRGVSAGGCAQIKQLTVHHKPPDYGFLHNFNDIESFVMFKTLSLEYITLMSSLRDFGQYHMGTY